MGRRAFLAGAGLVLAFSLLPPLTALADAVPAQLSGRDRADIKRIEAYLNGLTTMQARFQQYSAKAGLAFGSIWLERPGFIRVEYEPPSKMLILADSVSLHYYDPELDQINRVPLDASPLWFLLKKQAELGGNVVVTSFERDVATIAIGLAQKDSPEAGSVVLDFANNPLELRQWTIAGESGEAVRVSLYDQRFGMTIDHALFRAPKRDQRRD